MRREWTLESVLAAAADKNPLVEAARARLLAARGARRTAGALPNPIATYQVENTAFPGRPAPPGLNRETSTFLSVPLEGLYQRWPRVKRADEEIKAADAAVVIARRQVMLNAAHAFYRLALAQVGADVAAETSTALARLESLNRVRVREGAAAEGDLIRLQVELARAESDLVLEDVELSRARADLLPFLGDFDSNHTPPDSVRVVIDGARAAPIPLPPPTGLVATALRVRPELVEARARVAAAGAESRYQRTLTIRQLGATFGSKRINGENSMIAGLSLPIPLFDQNRGEVQRASAERVAAEQELAWGERTLSAQVQAAYDAANKLSAQAARLQESFLSRAEEARRITLTAYEEGAATLLQVLDATRALGDARVTYYRILFEQRQSLLDLAAAVGEDPALAPRSISSYKSSITGKSPKDGQRAGEKR
jgi:cobalt-zinc-cadmium efflux system outer membrane protein